MRNKTSTILLPILVLVFAPGFVVGDVVKDIAVKAAEAAFSEAERQAIEKYYEVTAPIRGREYEENDDDDKNEKRKSGGKKKDKGKGKKSGLPKGIAKKLERGGTLPPGHAKRYLPGDLKTQLPTVPNGYERIESDGQVLLTNIATGIIADIINITGKPDAKVSKEKPAVKSSTREESKTPEKDQTPEKPEKKWWQIWKE